MFYSIPVVPSGESEKKLATKGEMDSLQSNARARECRSHIVERYEMIVAERKREQAKRIPSHDFIANCDRILMELKPLYERCKNGIVR